MIMGNNKNCLVFVTHKLTEDILRYLSFLEKEVDGLMDLLVLYDGAMQPIDIEYYPNLRFYVFDSTNLSGFFHCRCKLLPNPLRALIECAKVYKYDHFLLMENDIVFYGNFKSFIHKINSEVNVDYIHIATDIEGSIEKHWPIKYIQDNPFEMLYFSWCQLFYISRRLMSEIEEFIKVNDSFYYEFLLPTFAYNKKFFVKQFENYGYQFQLSWGPVELYEYKYKYKRAYNTFYHPIKNLSIVDFEDKQII